jgi:hypothetical protein
MLLGSALGEDIYKMFHFLDLFRREMAELFKQRLFVYFCHDRSSLS